MAKVLLNKAVVLDRSMEAEDFASCLEALRDVVVKMQMMTMKPIVADL